MVSIFFTRFEALWSLQSGLCTSEVSQLSHSSQLTSYAPGTPHDLDLSLVYAGFMATSTIGMGRKGHEQPTATQVNDMMVIDWHCLH